ncbi:galectin-8-like isoform X2 [Atheta coriaria]|uniref:galectin-8-like isoform X2 n=1 Tax=Dalotia coriaria TaxID=877792 RepID=UPI0031F38BEB
MVKSQKIKNSTTGASGSASNNNNVYQHCCCMRKNSVDEDSIEKDFVIVNQQPSTQIVHVHPVGKCLDPGSYLVVRGRTHFGCTRFAVDFTCGNRSLVDGTIAFHFNPRLQEGYVVRNSLLKGYWGEEETTSPTRLTLRPDEAFELIFYLTASDFYVSVNGRHFCSFRHRVHHDRITNVEFVGDITITECHTKHFEDYPFIPENKLEVYEIPCDENYTDDQDLKLRMPFLGKLSQPLNIGTQLEICGKVKLLPHSFYVNLQNGLNIHPHAIIPLHLNPRFSACCGANAFVRNAWSDGKWYNEERAPGFPFSPGYSFTLVIRVEMDFYAIYVNNQLIAEYPYRVRNKHFVSAVYIQGDIYLRHISIQKKSRYAQYGFNEEHAGLVL